MFDAVLGSLPATLLVEGGIFLTLAVGLHLGKKVLKSLR